MTTVLGQRHPGNPDTRVACGANAHIRGSGASSRCTLEANLKLKKKKKKKPFSFLNSHALIPDFRPVLLNLGTRPLMTASLHRLAS